MTAGESVPASWDIRTVDYHTGGEPFRIVEQLPFTVAGSSVLERRESARVPESAADTLRRLLVNEPRGHADMYGGFIVPPNDDDADFGVLFWHKDGFSTACGHGTIALGVWAVRTGRVAADPSGETRVVIDVPSGRVTATVRSGDAPTGAVGGRAVGGGVVSGRVVGGRVVVGRVAAGASATFRNVPSRLTARDVAVETAGWGTVTADIVWGGATYASVRAADLGLRVVPEQLACLIDAGRQVKAALADHPAARHPSDRRLDGVYGTILFEDVPSGVPRGSVAQRNVTIFADGQVDRSPCGSGTAARAAALAERGVLAPDGVLEHYSIIGSHFTAHVVEQLADGAVVDVVGTAHPVAECRFQLDAADELGLGFTLR